MNIEMDINVRRRKTEESDIAEPPTKQIRGCDVSTESNNRVQEDVSGRKRKADSENARTSAKRMRCSSSTCITVSSTTQSSANEFSSTGSFVTVSSRPGSSSSKFSSVEFFLSAVEDKKDDAISHTFNKTSLEEEKIFEMASSGNSSRDEFEEKYLQQGCIGAGGFGSVYAGIRKEDSLPVCNGKVFDVLLEVALMLKAAGLPGSVGQSAMISLLDWCILEDGLILVLERPANSQDLFDYLQINRGHLSEHEAKMILKQMVDAAIDMHAKGVFHRDIKLENTLIQQSSTGAPRVRVIDFGCGSFSTEAPFKSFCGTLEYAPPEWFDDKSHSACPTTVWQLGALFFNLLHKGGYFSTAEFVKNHIQFSKALSQDTKTLLNMCLARDPKDRATLEELQCAGAHLFSIAVCHVPCWIHGNGTLIRRRNLEKTQLQQPKWTL
ncbi:serine/threonine-protein kinase pim-2-like isoform X2 [Scomber scombrus]|uniref:non-specific serine/threonine protein kinase n=1 Tax=Scomber scombrus TaxID=13677 RepID=A0AAV1P816_SCOSC